MICLFCLSVHYYRFLNKLLNPFSGAWTRGPTAVLDCAPRSPQLLAVHNQKQNNILFLIMIIMIICNIRRIMSVILIIIIIIIIIINIIVIIINIIIINVVILTILIVIIMLMFNLAQRFCNCNRTHTRTQLLQPCPGGPKMFVGM